MPLYVRYLHVASFVTVNTQKPDPNEKLFSHRDLDGVYRHFYIPQLKRLNERYRCPQMQAAITPHQIQFIRKNHGVEQSRLDTLPPAMIDIPGLVCEFDTGEQLVVDGSHRFVWRGEHGYDTMNFYIIPEPVWRLSLLDVPVELNATLAGR